MSPSSRRSSQDPFARASKPAAKPAPAKPTADPAAKAPAADPFLGREVGRCKLEARIGAGKTSLVYRATHTGLNRPVAVKILQPAVLQYPEVVAKFDEEARAVARLDHENILKIYDVVTEGDVHGIVMELLEGESVLDVITREGRLDPTDAMRVVRQAASGLLAAHHKDIIHRDVKPQNLVLLPDGTVKVVDFGLATAADSELAAARIGTPHYMSPEVCQAKPAETKSDVYGLGITLYHLLVGGPPYAGQSIKEILASHVEGRPLHPERHAPKIPKDLGDLVRAMTKRDPVTRLDMDGVIAELDRIGGAALESRPTIRPRRSGRRRRATSGPMIAIGLGAAAIVVLVVALSSRGGGGGKPSGPANDGSSTAAVDPSPAPTPAPVAPTPEGTSPMTDAPPAHVETPQEREAREKREKDAEATAKEVEARKAFETAENYARQNWQDKASVAQQYKSVAQRFVGTETGKKALKRSQGITANEIHPHPDRAYTRKDEVEAAKQKWLLTKVPFEAAIAAGKYAEAAAMAPPEINDGDGSVAKEFAFWRRTTRDLLDFRRVMQEKILELPEERRTVRLAAGSAKISDTTESGLVVRDENGARKVPWTEVPLDATALLATKALAGKGWKGMSLFAAFAFAHGRRDNFFAALATAMSAPDLPKDVRDQLEAYQARIDERGPK
jgi:serine/threonine protein kinase